MSCAFMSSAFLSATSRLARSASRTQKRRSHHDAAGSWWRRLWRPRQLLDPYRPELHYMRGPGPKWREKHLRLPAPQPEPASRRAPDHSGQRSI
jgi:hypothetical protein